jgi:hypothetical protein
MTAPPSIDALVDWLLERAEKANDSGNSLKGFERYLVYGARDALRAAAFDLQQMCAPSPGYVKPGDAMVERVARAIVPVMCGDREDEHGNDLPPMQFDDLTADWQEAYRGYARAAIAALTPLPNPSQSTASDTPSTPG